MSAPSSLIVLRLSINFFALEPYLGVDVIAGESILINEADCQPPHKIDENMWKNREYIEETIFLLEKSNWPEEVMNTFFLIHFTLSLTD